MKNEIKKIVQDAIGGEQADSSVEIPSDKTHGDYSSSIALVLAKKTGKNPKEVAESIKEKIICWGKQKLRVFP